MGIYTLVRGAKYGSSINQPPNLGFGCSVYGLGKGDCREELEDGRRLRRNEKGARLFSVLGKRRLNGYLQVLPDWTMFLFEPPGKDNFSTFA